jgi:prepilin-type processing-associated H-X9-DG protein
MTLVESFAWSAIVVSLVAVGVWLIGAAFRRIGVSLGVAPAWAALACIPLLTAAAFVPSFTLAESKSNDKPLSVPATFNTSPVDLNSIVGPATAPSNAASELRTQDQPAASAAVATPADRFWNWTAVRERVEPAFRAAAPWLAAIMLAGLAIGWLRLAIGWRAVDRLARNSRPIDDAELRELFDVLRAELSCSNRIELRESPGLASPAAVGWRNPAVLLPSDWRQWSESERRAVLAHEIAHVKRGDFAAWIVAQACAAVHFFNPLVQGVSRWLRMEQECSADAEAARLAGGRSEYLRVLASLAVRQRDVSSAWPARCFLPVRGSFVRRIEMLRSHPPRWSVKTAAGNALLMTCVAAAGLALSAFRPAFASATSSAETTAAAGGIHIPQTAIAAGHIRVAEGIKHPQFGKLVEKFVKEAPPFRKLIAIDDVERLGLVVLATDQTPGFDGAIVLVHKTKWDLAKILAAESGLVSHVEGGKTVIRENERIVGLLLDEKTLVFGDRPLNGEKVFRAMTGPRNEGLEKTLSRADASIVAFATSGSEFFGAIVAKPNPGTEMAAGFAKPMVDGQQSMLLRIDAKDGVKATIEAEYSTPELATTAGKTAEAALTLLGNFVRSAAAGVPKDDSKSAPLKLAKTALDSMKVRIDGAKVAVNGQVASSELTASLAAAMEHMQTDSARMAGANNLKQIGLAIHNYAAVHNKLPAAAAPEGDGKFPVSWRVRILPYIDQDALYRQYKMDEPWDSEHNKKLLGKMPVTYRNPVKPSATETPYQVLVGDNTIFPAAGGVGFMDIVDGTSNTILAIETGAQVPWTKPEDVKFPFPVQGKPDFGGLHEGGYNVLMGDGSVQFFSKHLDPKALHSFITRNGGEVIEPNPAVARPNRKPASVRP